MRLRLAATAVLAVMTLTVPAFAHPPAPTSGNLQGGDQHAWIANPHMHAFYDATVAAFAQGPARIDVQTYEQTSFAIFREFGVSMGWKPEAMQDHLKLIPRQVVQIVKEDPKVLDSYDNFIAAIMGPQ